MARRNISLPDGLDDEARRARLNVSALAQRAVAGGLGDDGWADAISARGRRLIVVLDTGGVEGLAPTDETCRARLRVLREHASDTVPPAAVRADDHPGRVARRRTRFVSWLRSLVDDSRPPRLPGATILHMINTVDDFECCEVFVSDTLSLQTQGAARCPHNAASGVVAVDGSPAGHLFHAEPSEFVDVDRLMEQVDHVLTAREKARFGCEKPHGHAEIPPSVLEALRAVVTAMSKGQTITIVPYGQVLTTQQAADLLHVSRPHLIKLLERGEIPFFRTDERAGAHRRIALQDVVRYRDARNERRRGKLAELTRLAAEYEGDYS